MKDKSENDLKTCDVEYYIIFAFMFYLAMIVRTTNPYKWKHDSFYEIFGWEVSLYVIIKLMCFEMKSSEVLMCQVMKASYRYNQVKKETWRKLNRYKITGIQKT